MESAHKSATIDLSPTRGASRPEFQEILRTEEIEEKLQEGKRLHDAMFLLEDIISYRHKLFVSMNSLRAEMHALTSNAGSGIWKLRNDIEERIQSIQKDDAQLAKEAEEIKEEVERMFDEIEKDDDPKIKDLVQRRRDLQQRFDSHQCDGLGVVKNTCVEVDQLLREVTLQILIQHTEHYWSSRSLKEFVPTIDFPHPGAFQAHPAYMDLKAIADGSQKIAIITASSETDATEDMIARENLSVMFVHSPSRKIVYRPDAADEARHLASLLETHGNRSNKPETLYNYYLKLGTLLGQESDVAKAFALKKARKKDKDFVPEEIEKEN